MVYPLFAVSSGRLHTAIGGLALKEVMLTPTSLIVTYRDLTFSTSYSLSLSYHALVPALLGQVQLHNDPTLPAVGVIPSMSRTKMGLGGGLRGARNGGATSATQCI